MTHNHPLVSVIMPSYNAEAFIKEAIESIVQQSFTDFEFVIIDDGSTDKTREIITQYARKDARIILIHNKKREKICHSLNKGIAVSRGVYIARMDADDWSYPKRLDRQVSVMEDHPDVSICGGEIQVCDVNLKILNSREYPLTDRDVREKIFRLNPFAHPAVMYKKDTVKKVGGYNPALYDAEDYDLYFRLGRYGKFYNLSGPLLKLRTHPYSVSEKRVSRQVKLNLYVRLKAATEYGYKMRFIDVLFFAVHVVGFFVIPHSFKLKFYNRWRTWYT